MAHAIIRGANGRRRDVDFEGADNTVEICFGVETVEIFVEALDDLVPSDKRRFALLNVPRELFAKASAKRRVVRRVGARRGHRPGLRQEMVKVLRERVFDVDQKPERLQESPASGQARPRHCRDVG